MAPSVIRRRPAAVFFSAVFAIIAYFALFPHPLGRETVARPAWAVRVPSPDDPAAVAAPAEEQGLAWFQIGDVFGYVDSEGRFAHVEKRLYQVALSNAGFVNYTRLGTDWILENTRGRRVLSFSGNGYPLLSSDGRRVFVVRSDLSGLREIDASGETRWTRDFPSLLTTLCIQGDSILAGLLDGTMTLIDENGLGVTEEAPQGSRIPVVFGAALGAEGRLAASVSGIDPQFLAVYERVGAGLQRRAVEKLASDFRREVRLSFAPDGRFLAFEGVGGAGLFDATTLRSSRVAVRGALVGISFPGNGRQAAFAAFAPGLADLAVVTPLVGPVFQESFAAREVFLGSIDGQLLLGADGRLLRIDMVAM